MTRAGAVGSFTKSAWLELGLGVLAKSGPEALTIERLVGEAGKTKGSFYHHFTSHQGFVIDLLSHWHAGHTQALIAAANAEPMADRKRTLDQLALGLDFAIEIGVRRLAAVEPVAQDMVREVDEHRIAYLAHLNAGRRRLESQAARNLAELEYAAFIGGMFVFGDKPRARIAEMCAVWTALLDHAAEQSSRPSC